MLPLIPYLGLIQMTKQEAIRIIIACADLYQANFENANILILSHDKNHTVHAIETLFLPRNFMHLTGVKTDPSMSAVSFYEKCLDRRLSPSDFELAKDGTTKLKLDVLPALLKPHMSARMIGDFDTYSPKLVTEKLVGSVTACMGFMKDGGFYYPMTVLKEDIRNVTKNPQQRIIAIFKKDSNEKEYCACTYLAKGIRACDITLPSGVSCAIDARLVS